MDLFHVSLSHFGRKRKYNIKALSYTWKGMKCDVVYFVSRCKKCLCFKKIRQSYIARRSVRRIIRHAINRFDLILECRSDSSKHKSRQYSIKCVNSHRHRDLPFGDTTQSWWKISLNCKAFRPQMIILIKNDQV